MPEQSPSGQGRSTGPRTAAGRKRAAQNARKHGLTALPPDSTAIIAQVQAWADDTTTDAVRETALARLAQARLSVARVRAHQAALLDNFSSLSPTGTGTQSEAVAQFALSLRYRSEAEASARKALRDVVIDWVTADPTLEA